MKLLVDARSPNSRGRIERAALGLAARGHETIWLGPVPADAPATVRSLSLFELGRTQADVVIGAGTPFSTVLAGWLARARVLVHDLVHDRVATWSALDRWAWHSLYAQGLIEETEANRWRDDLRGLERERVALWPPTGATVATRAEHPDTEILERACERALARQRGRGFHGAVFLDRDGTLIREVGYLSDADGVELLPGAAAAVRRLRAAGFPAVVISNQAGVGRGLFPAARVHETMARLRERLRAEGAELDAIYFCPHRPEDECLCRKPGTALLERAADDLELSLRESVMIGDKLLDAATGQRAGGTGVLVRTGYGREEEAKVAENALGRPPDHVAEDLPDAASWWLSKL
jgi:D-glycero-D-manno-heptose 1,7-bisphosphate phosphatase